MNKQPADGLELGAMTGSGQSSKSTVEGDSLRDRTTSFSVRRIGQNEIEDGAAQEDALQDTKAYVSLFS